METANVLVVEVNAAARGQLVRALAQTINRNKLLAAQSLERGVEIIGGLQSTSIIFVSGALPNVELANFIERARGSAGGRESGVRRWWQVRGSWTKTPLPNG